MMALVVEDEPSVRAFLRAVLEDPRFDVILAEDGARAVERFGEERPDFLLMDLNLPEPDGLEATRRIRAIPEKRVPVLILTGAATRENVLQALRAGATGFLVKSDLSRPRLIGRIRIALRKQTEGGRAPRLRVADLV